MRALFSPSCEPMPVPRTPPKMFETRSQAWKEVGLLRQISPRVVKRARLEALLFVPLFVGVVILYENRVALLGTPTTVHGKPGPAVLEPALETPIRIVTVLVLFVALRVAGIEAKTLALGGAFTAVILGLAAQQTLGNLIAGTVLLSARPFRVGERVRLQGGPLAGQIEGTVSSLGLLYTKFATGDDSIMVPNSVVLSVAVLPLREPEAVNLRARLRAGMTPSDLQEVLERSLQTPLRDAPRITLEELDGEEVVVRIAATPVVASNGRQLASELLGVVSRETRSGVATRERRNRCESLSSAPRSGSSAGGRSSAPASIRSAGPDGGSPPASLGETDR